MNTLPKVSIIVPVYNVEPYLLRCLDSILNQTFTEFECILVDDCSPDNCPAMCDEYALKDHRIQVIHKKQNEGLPKARKSGTDKAKGEYIIHIDSDDWIESNMLEEMYTKAIEDNFDIVFCDSIEEGTGRILTNRPTSDFADKVKLIKQLFSLEVHPTVYTQLVKRSLLSKVLFPQVSCAEDWVVTTQTVHYAENITNIPTVFHHYCDNPNSLTRDNDLEVRKLNENYINYSQIVNFLKDKYNDISIFDPELSNFINKVKLGVILNKKTRKDTYRLFELYPRSNKLIFNRKSKFSFYHKILLFLATKKIMFPLRLLDLYYALRKKLQNRNR